MDRKKVADWKPSGLPTTLSIQHTGTWVGEHKIHGFKQLNKMREADGVHIVKQLGFQSSTYLSPEVLVEIMPSPSAREMLWVNLSRHRTPRTLWWAPR